LKFPNLVSQIFFLKIVALINNCYKLDFVAENFGNFCQKIIFFAHLLSWVTIGANVKKATAKLNLSVDRECFSTTLTFINKI
jgi:hypothetical protein